MRRLIMLGLIVPAVLSFSAISHAVPFTFSYSGTVNRSEGLPDNAAFKAFLGETMYLTYTFESSTADNNRSANGDYFRSITAFEVTVGANTYSADTGNIIITNNDVNPDQYLVDITSGLKGPGVGGIAPLDFRLNFSDFTHSVFYNDALPTVQPEPSNFSQAAMWLTFGNMDFSIEPEFGIIMADGTVQIAPVQSTPVPEPGTLLLFTAGSAGLIFHNRRRKRTRRLRK